MTGALWRDPARLRSSGTARTNAPPAGGRPGRGFPLEPFRMEASEALVKAVKAGRLAAQPGLWR